MFYNTLKKFALIPALAVLMLWSGCDSHDHDDDHDHFDHVERVEVRLRGTNELIAYFEPDHGDHWHGGLDHLHTGDSFALNVLFIDDDGNQAPLGGSAEYRLGAVLAPGAPTGVIEFDPHGDHVDIDVIGEGTTYLVFQLLHGNHSDFDTPPFEFEVDDH